MTIVSAYKTHTGRIRDHNEDYVLADEKAGVYIVADGLGGHEAGEVASRIAATTVGDMICAGIGAAVEDLSAAALNELLTTAIEAANGKVSVAAEKGGQDRHMGTVLVVALVRPPVAYISHAGDSRAYLVKGSTLTRLTQDDSVVQQLVASGVISEAEAREHPQRNLVTKIVGQDSPVRPSFREVALEPGDWLLLCSDGLWDMLDDEAILGHVLKADGDPVPATEALISAANAAGGRDNISVIAITLLPPENKGGP